MVMFHIVSKRLFLKLEGFSDARLVSISKNECVFAVHFCKDSQSLETQYLMKG